MSELCASLPGRLVALAEQHPHRVALREKRLGVWVELSWAQYRDEVAAVARMLWELGVRPGDTVAIASDNRTEWIFADLGAQALGAAAAGVYATSPAPDVAFILKDSGSKVLFCEDQEQLDKVIAIRDSIPTLAHVVIFDPRGTRQYQDERLWTWEAFISRGRALCALEPGFLRDRLATLDPEAPAMIVYTSGTTGEPKGAMLSSANVTRMADHVVAVNGFQAGDTLLSYLPLCHVAEKIFTLFTPLACGAVVHFGESLYTVQDDLREVAPSVFLGVPRIWEKMHAAVTVKMRDASAVKGALWRWLEPRGLSLALARLTRPLAWHERVAWTLSDRLLFRPLRVRLGLHNCRAPISGAAPIGIDTVQWFHGIGVPIREGYGLTECAGVSHLNPPGRVKLGTVGQPVPGVECRLADDGEILLRGPGIFLGYLHQPEATRAVLDAEGWLYTGDVGQIDSEGYLTITGRKKEIIITAGGKNLSPEHIENALKASPYIKEAVAVGDRQAFVTALIQVDAETVGDWASRRGIVFTSYADLAAQPAVRKLVADEVTAANDRLASVEQVKTFRILPKELHQDDGELTATQKVRRRAVLAAYGEMIHEMYGG